MWTLPAQCSGAACQVMGQAWARLGQAVEVSPSVVAEEVTLARGHSTAFCVIKLCLSGRTGVWTQEC